MRGALRTSPKHCGLHEWGQGTQRSGEGRSQTCRRWPAGGGTIEAPDGGIGDLVSKNFGL